MARPEPASSREPLTARADALRRLGTEHWDVVVVGGGITGCGVALDAASRGLRTALVERDDLASGTSSKSSKLVHGGVRYLRQADFGLVHEALGERRRLLKLAPHLVEPLPFVFPIVAARGQGFGRARLLALSSRIGLALYDLLGGRRLHRTERVSVERAMELMPALDRERVSDAFVYYDAHTDDARLTLTIARTAAQRYGATIVNHCDVEEFLHEGGRACGLVVRDAQRDERFDVRSRALVNATGVWADELRRLDEGRHPASLRPAKGVHLAVPRERLRSRSAAILGVAGDDRMIFVVPWGDHTYIGTTDTAYDGPLDEPVCTRADVDYLLGAVNAVVAEPLRAEDVTGTWAGLRPLLRAGDARSTERLSRKHAVLTSASGVVTVTGGKLTTYRRMAQDAVDAALTVLGESPRRRRSRTERIPLLGALGRDAAAEDPAVRALGDEAAAHLLHRFGSLAPEVARLVADDPTLGEPLVPGLPYLRAEARYAVDAEWALGLDDVLARRTRALLLDNPATRQAAPAVAALLGDRLGWDAEARRREVEAFEAQARRDDEAVRPATDAVAAAAGS